MARSSSNVSIRKYSGPAVGALCKGKAECVSSVCRYFQGKNHGGSKLLSNNICRMGWQQAVYPVAVRVGYFYPKAGKLCLGADWKAFEAEGNALLIGADKAPRTKLDASVTAPE